MKYSKDGRVSFDPEKHIYMLGNKQLTGVTTYISKFKNKFDSDTIAEKYAKKNGLIKEEVLAKWEAEGELSIKTGSTIHSFIEHFILTGEIQEIECPKINIAQKFIEEVFKTNRLTPVECEIVVYDEEMGLASMIDCIAKNDKDEYFILDWKTNKKIDYDSWGKYMLAPYSLPDANYYHYSLQLSLYKRMYKEHPIKDIFIIHIGQENYSIIPAQDIPIV